MNDDLDLSLIPDTPCHADSSCDKDRYTREFKIQCALEWLLIGEYTKTAAKMEIPLKTLQQWVKSEWWPVAVAAARKLFGDDINSRLKKIQLKVFDELADRVENGNEVLARDGSSQRVKVPAKDLAVIGAISFDKHQIINGDATSISKRLNRVQTKEQRANELREKARESRGLRVVGGTEGGDA